MELLMPIHSVLTNTKLLGLKRTSVCAVQMHFADAAALAAVDSTLWLATCCTYLFLQIYFCTCNLGNR